MNLIITLALILLVSYVIAALFRKLRLPGVVGLIIGGLLLGLPAIERAFIQPNTKLVFILGDIGLISVMFIAGLESSWREIYKEKKDAFFIAIFAALVPFLLGLFTLRLLGFSYLIASTVGICMSITAEATKAKVLMDMDKLDTKIGAAMLGAGIIDDIIGLTLFLVIAIIAKHNHIMEDILIIATICAFFAGILIQKSIGRRNKIIKELEKALMIGIIPFFFISMGIHFDHASVMPKPFLLITIISIAIVGKILGTILTKPLLKFKWRQLILIGWGMNSRGAVELGLAMIAFRTGMIPQDIYASLVLMALVTTLIFPFVIARMISKYPHIMN